MQRRAFLRAALTTAQLSLLVASGLMPRRVLADWPADAFHAESLPDAERVLFGAQQIVEFLKRRTILKSAFGHFGVEFLARMNAIRGTTHFINVDGWWGGIGRP